MEYVIANRFGFHLIGMSVRTTAAGGRDEQDIDILTRAFLENGLYRQIPNKLTEAVYRVYMNYDAGGVGGYTVMVGCRVSMLESIPVRMEGIFIAAGKYAVYERRGELPAVVREAWDSFAKEKQLARRYGADYEIYLDPNDPPERAEVCICISI